MINHKNSTYKVRLKETTGTSDCGKNHLLVRCDWFSVADDVSGDITVTSSGLVWAWLFGVLDGVERSADVEVFGLKETSQPAAFIGETHGQHEGQRLHQARVRLCGGGQEGEGRGQRSEVSRDIGQEFTEQG